MEMEMTAQQIENMHQLGRAMNPQESDQVFLVTREFSDRLVAQKMTKRIVIPADWKGLEVTLSPYGVKFLFAYIS